MNMNKNPMVILFSDPNFLALKILDKLILEGYLVRVVTDHEKEWRLKTLDLPKHDGFVISSISTYVKVPSFSYAIFCGGFIKKKSALTDFKKFLLNKNFHNSKTIALLPFEINNEIKNIAINNNSGIVYLGDLLGKNIDLNSDLLIPSLLNQIISKHTLTLAIGELFTPLDAGWVTQFVINNLNKDRFYGKVTILAGRVVTSEVFWKLNLKKTPTLKINYNTKLRTRQYPPSSSTTRVNTDFQDVLDKTYSSVLNTNDMIPPNIDKLNKTSTQSKASRNKINNTITKIKPKNYKSLRKTVLGLLFILIFPFITLIIGTLTFYISGRELLKDNIGNSNKGFMVAKSMYQIGYVESRLLAKIPIFSFVYKESLYASYLGTNLSDMAVNLSPTFITAKSLVNNVLGPEPYDIEKNAMQVKSDLSYTYNQLSLIQIETKLGIYKQSILAKQVLGIVDFDKVKNLLQQGILLSDNIPGILGFKNNKSYLILFQNNMELRPTGGFIGSYGIAGFSGGRLSELNINDIYSADGQLKGHIEPPDPIRKYLGEANWYFRDSNWNPDFTVSATRAEWFLNKEMDQQVDGTIAIDLTPIKNILYSTGPVFLPDYNLTITPENLYEKTQEESQANFFPGSRKKASFLTALSRSLLTTIPKLSSKQKLGVLLSLYKGLESRSIQVYFHNDSIQEPIDKLSWSGNFTLYSCGDSCYSDYFSEVEANLGVNKSNYFISRNIDFNASLEKGILKRSSLITLKNLASQSLGASGQYKTYLRINIPIDAVLTSATVINGQTQTLLQTDTAQSKNGQEIGVYVEVLPGDTRKIKFEWGTDLTNKIPLSYGLFIRKQAGTENDPLSVQLTSQTRPLKTQPTFALTSKGVYKYNTTLGKDFFARVSFEDK